jgi:hypothetical protein
VTATDPGASNCQSWEYAGWTCGMEHAVSLRGSNDHPWATSFGSAAKLVIQSPLYLKGYTYNCGSPKGCGAAWADVCALLQDTSKVSGPGLGPYTIELCISKWDTGWVYADYPVQVYNDTQGHPFASVTTNFSNSDRTSLYGSSPTTPVGSGAVGHYYDLAATISGPQLVRIVDAINNYILANHKAYLPYSTTPSDYQLVGLEDGIEMWGGNTTLGAYNGSGLDAWTSY